MAAVQRFLPTLLSLACLAVVALVTVQNWNDYVPVNLPGLPPQTYFSIGSLVLMAALLGSLASFLRFWEGQQRLRYEIKQAELRKEKAEVKTETHTDQIRALENKVETLEKALEQALSAASSRRE